MTKSALSILAALALSLSAVSLSACNRAPKTNPVISSGKADIGGPFNLINQDGEAVNFETYQGKPQIIYFGFAYCPDICPTSLQKIGAALSMLGDDAVKFQPMLFSIDPARDTPASLKLYVSANGFPQNLVALTGTQEQVDGAIKAYRVYAKKVKDPDSESGYTMDHSSLTYLMDETGEFYEVFPHEMSPADMAARLKLYLKAQP
ncbi:MAG: SCO family protein [Robiginitomaculum sp.]